MQVVFDLDLQPVQSSVLPLNADDAIAIGRYLLVFRILTIPFTARDDFNGDVRHRFSIEQYTETGCFSSDQVIGMGGKSISRPLPAMSMDLPPGLPLVTIVSTWLIRSLTWRSVAVVGISLVIADAVPRQRLASP